MKNVSFSFQFCFELLIRLGLMALSLHRESTNPQIITIHPLLYEYFVCVSTRHPLLIPFAAFAVLLTILIRPVLYCRNNDLVSSLRHPTTYCIISGMLISDYIKVYSMINALTLNDFFLSGA